MSIEKINDVRTIMIHKMCKCGGEFKPDGMCLMSNPPQYPHICLKCGERETFTSKYPKLDYIEIEK